jgi:hypothetical protein
MGSTNIVAYIGRTLFFLKFYIYIGLKLACNFIQYHYEKFLHGNSNIIICPFKNTHEDVFRSIGKLFCYSEELIALEGFTIDNY